MNIKEEIENWLEIDNEINNLNNKLKQLRIQKNNYNNTIIKYFENKNITNPTIKIEQGFLKIDSLNLQQSLSFKFLQECLNEYNKNNINETEKIINFIKNKRRINYYKQIKRIYS